MPDQMVLIEALGAGAALPQRRVVECRERPVVEELLDPQPTAVAADLEAERRRIVRTPRRPSGHRVTHPRSEERRVGKECGTRRTPYHSQEEPRAWTAADYG